MGARGVASYRSPTLAWLLSVGRVTVVLLVIAVL
jgi:hypothetical protein